MKRVLVLGSGLVAGPLIRYLLDAKIEVVVATLLVDRARALVGNRPHGRAVYLNVEDDAALGAMVADADLTVSLLPFGYHPAVAKHCVAHRKHMVTTSYVSPAMQEHDRAARAAGVALVNEVGVDPGIDHMSAMRVIDAARKRRAKVVAFRSYCGGLPAPEANDNPFGYKFSWAPRGVLLAARNGASYLLDGRRVDVPPADLFRDMQMFPVEGVGFFEAYPNRDSIAYIDAYGLNGIDTMFRGTLRNVGWCDIFYSFRKLGLLELDLHRARGKTYSWLLRKVLGIKPRQALAAAVAARLGIHPLALPVTALRWLGMLGDRRLSAPQISPLDALAHLMIEKLSYRPGERDMLVMVHDFRIEGERGARERVTSTLVDFGQKRGDSSMARTVSLPAAISARMLLEGRLEATGVLRPLIPELYLPILDELAHLGIECKEKREAL
ncbi:MAG: saccharopine dehydrogenase NADP-binding domain-containing protein [Deltaproteobacteria bacterium]|nr:saccharopine dehydrogenase NADP-binding domain-containing protein [Deltaproteobacteria bacterium]